MKFNSINDIRTAMQSLGRDNGGRRVFPVLFKKAVVEFINNSEESRYSTASACGFGDSMLYAWSNQYDKGLYTLEGALTVSSKVKAVNSAILTKLNTDIDQIRQQIALIEQCELLGLKVVV